MSQKVEVQLPPWQDPGKIGLVMVFAIGFQILVLVGLTIKGAMPRMIGEKVRLYVIPIDPRDLMRGDYVILGYDFSTFPPSPDKVDQELKGNNFQNWKTGKPVYVSLKYRPVANIWEADYFHARPPAQGKFIKGQFSNHPFRLEFGIEQFFVQEGKGHVYEDAIRKGKLVAEVFITPDGTAQVNRLHIENQDLRNLNKKEAK